MAPSPVLRFTGANQAMGFGGLLEGAVVVQSFVGAIHDTQNFKVILVAHFVDEGGNRRFDGTHKGCGGNVQFLVSLSLDAPSVVNGEVPPRLGAGLNGDNGPGEGTAENISVDFVIQLFEIGGYTAVFGQFFHGMRSFHSLKSKRVKITGAASTYTKVYTVDQMKYLIRNIELVKNPVDRAYLAIQAMHPLRLEEVLGLKWCDVDTENLTLHICRAVTHPTRNQPEIKDTKTEASRRIISLSQITASHLSPGNEDDYIFGGAKPYSYQQVKRMCERIRSDTGFDDKITPIRFRTTVLTDIYEATKDVKAAQAAAGHTTPAMTMKRYVKGRGTTSQTAAAIDQLYGS